MSFYTAGHNHHSANQGPQISLPRSSDSLPRLLINYIFTRRDWRSENGFRVHSGVGKGGAGGATAPPLLKVGGGGGGAMPPYFYTSDTTDKCVICNKLH